MDRKSLSEKAKATADSLRDDAENHSHAISGPPGVYPADEMVKAAAVLNACAKALSK